MFPGSTFGVLAQALRGLQGVPPPRLPGHGMPILGTEVPQAPRGGTEHPNFFFRARRARHGVPGRACISRDGPPRATPGGNFEKGHVTLLPQGMCSPRGPVDRTLGGNFFFFSKTRFL
jgi:hypothetical protein